MEHTFAATDAEGVEHRYSVTRHAPSEGRQLVLHLAALLVEPVVAGMGPVVVQGVSNLFQRRHEKGAAQRLSVDAVVQLLEEPEFRMALDFGRVAVGIRTALLGLNPEVQNRILSLTNRDGKPLIQAGKPTLTFEGAYQANYLELARALWEVVRINRFLPGVDTIASGLGPLVDQMRETLASASSN